MDHLQLGTGDWIGWAGASEDDPVFHRGDSRGVTHRDDPSKAMRIAEADMKMYAGYVRYIQDWLLDMQAKHGIDCDLST
jgi:hypothetical protein